MAGRQPVVSDADILRVLAQHGDPVLSTAEVAENLPIGEKGAYRRLRELRDAGSVESKKIGRGRAWWLTDAGLKVLEEG